MVPIYVKTVYSFLSSLITVDDLITFAKENDYHDLCICDDNMYGVMEFITKCYENNINPIVGLDIGICLLYAKDYIGYQNLMHLETIQTERSITLDDLSKYHESIVCFINNNSDLKEELINLYEDFYLYDEKNDDSDIIYLHKTLCLKQEDSLNSYFS